MLASLFCDKLNRSFYTGVPDSLLAPLCDCLFERYGLSERHVIGANEGCCVGLAAGHWLATGEAAGVYMQNSGIGNAANPIISLLDRRVCGIPCLFIVGWRGEPCGEHDEPQHAFQGEITVSLLREMGLAVYIVEQNTTAEEMDAFMADAEPRLHSRESVAFVVKKGALTRVEKTKHSNSYQIVREMALEALAEISSGDIVVSTTGKISRELYEIRGRTNGGARDFMTVGSMGHCSSIALKLAMERPCERVWCADGDGAVLMHLGAMATIGSIAPKNLIHVVFNNGAHGSVGGLPTCAADTDIAGIALACGYQRVVTVCEPDDVQPVLCEARERGGLALVEIKTSLVSRGDLGRPKERPYEAAARFMAAMTEGKRA